jgi:hypothetical protein
MITAGSAGKKNEGWRSHVVLHCSNESLAAARLQAWGGARPSDVRTLLASPRWEGRLLHFLELSGVGRVVDSEEADRAARMDS